MSDGAVDAARDVFSEVAASDFAVGILIERFIENLSLFFSSGDISLLLGAVIVLLPLAGFIYAVYALIKYLGIITIFKDQQHHKFAGMFAIGIALVAAFFGPAFNIFVGFLTGSWLSLILLIFGVAAIIIFVNRLRGSSNSAVGDLNQSRTHRREASAGDLKAKSLERQAKHDTGLHKKTLNNEKQLVKSAREQLGFKTSWFGKSGGALRLTGNIFDDLKEIEKLLTKLDGISDSPDGERLKQQLSSQVQTATVHLREQYARFSQINAILQKEKSLEVNTLKIDDDEKAVVQQLKNRLNQSLKSQHGSARKTTTAINNHLKHNLYRLEQLVQEVFSLDKRKKQLIDNAAVLDRDAINSIQRSLQDLTAVLSDLSSGNVSQARVHISEVMQLERRILAEEQKINLLLVEWSNFANKEANIDSKIQSLERSIIADFEKSQKSS